MPAILEWRESPEYAKPVPDPLQELRDVHLPDPISWWPPAFGWWMVIVGLVIAGGLVVWAMAYRKRTRPRRIALAQLQQVKQQYSVNADDQLAITQMSQSCTSSCACGVSTVSRRRVIGAILAAVFGYNGTARINFQKGQASHYDPVPIRQMESVRQENFCRWLNDGFNGFAHLQGNVRHDVFDLAMDVGLGTICPGLSGVGLHQLLSKPQPPCVSLTFGIWLSFSLCIQSIRFHLAHQPGFGSAS